MLNIFLLLLLLLLFRSCSLVEAVGRWWWWYMRHHALAIRWIQYSTMLQCIDTKREQNRPFDYCVHFWFYFLFCSINLFPFTLCINVLTCCLPLKWLILSKSEIVHFFIFYVWSLNRDVDIIGTICIYFRFSVFIFSSIGVFFSTHFSDIQSIEQWTQSIENYYYVDARWWN